MVGPPGSLYPEEEGVSKTTAWHSEAAANEKDGEDLRTEVTGGT